MKWLDLNMYIGSYSSDYKLPNGDGATSSLSQSNSKMRKSTLTYHLRSTLLNVSLTQVESSKRKKGTSGNQSFIFLMAMLFYIYWE